MGDRAQLSQFLRARREAIQPEDLGLPRGPRRRTSGLRREEVAALSGISSDDTPAQVVTMLGETLVQTRMAVALLGDETNHTGPRRNRVYRWFTDPAERAHTPSDDHERHSILACSMQTITWRA